MVLNRDPSYGFPNSRSQHPGQNITTWGGSSSRGSSPISAFQPCASVGATRPHSTQRGACSAPCRNLGPRSAWVTYGTTIAPVGLCSSSRRFAISFPNGTSAAPAILKLATPSGMPTIVRQRRMPVKRCPSASHQPCEDEPGDVADHADTLAATLAWNERAAGRPQGVACEFERLHPERDADDRDAKKYP